MEELEEFCVGEYSVFHNGGILRYSGLAEQTAPSAQTVMWEPTKQPTSSLALSSQSTSAHGTFGRGRSK